MNDIQYFPNSIIAELYPVDPRFFKNKLQREEVMKVLYELLYNFNQFYKGDYWLAYGSLLGGIRHNGIIPWDGDIDLHVWAKDLKKNPNFETDKYIWFVIPSAHTEEIDRLNGIDARLISKETGIYIDIMAVHDKQTHHIIKHEILRNDRWTHERFERKHRIEPFLYVTFGDMECKVPNDYNEELHSLYGSNFLTNDANGNIIHDLSFVESPYNISKNNSNDKFFKFFIIVLTFGILIFLIYSINYHYYRS